MRDVYHKPTDDLNQPVDVEAAALFDRVITALLQRVADDPARPHVERRQLLQAFLDGQVACTGLYLTSRNRYVI